MTQAATEPTADTQPSSGPSFGPSGGPSGGIDAPPPWLRLLALASAAGVLSFGAVGLLLAVNGWYRPALAFPLGAVAWVGVLALARPVFAPKVVVAREAHVYAALGVAAILAITVWNASYASQHVLINRDGGSYANSARWIARDGSLAVEPRVGAFANDKNVTFDSFGVYQMPDGTLQFQFAHLLTVVLAEAFAIGGNAGLFHAPELLGGIALLAFYLLAWRLLRRPLFALAAMLALAFIIPQISFSRDSYSEIPSQILLFTALWLLVSPRVVPSWRVALTSGLFLGALEAVRIDAISFVIGVPVFIAVAWLCAADAERRRTALASGGAFVAGLVPGLVLGLVDLTRHSGTYYSDLSDKVKQLDEAVVGSAVLCLIVVLVGSRAEVTRGLRRLNWSVLATAAGVLVGLAGFLAWFVRPRILVRGGAAPVVLGFQGAEHVALDPTRKYFERSFIWMSWYLGPVTLAVAIIAAALLMRALLLGRMRRTIGALAVLAPGTLMYLYKADAVPDHPWVTRRFLVGAFPVLILLALGLAAAFAGPRARSPGNGRGRVARQAGAVMFAIAAVAYPIFTVKNLGAMTEERGYLAVVTEVCGDIGPKAAVVVLERDAKDLFDDWVPQTLRSWCGAEVGQRRGPLSPDAFRALARSWSAQGRRLFLVAGESKTISTALPGVAVTTTREAVNVNFLRQALTHRPNAYARSSLSMAVAQVPTG